MSSRDGRRLTARVRAATVAFSSPSRPDGEDLASQHPELTISYLQHLHSYVYDLKREAEERARALVTVTAIYVAAAAFIIRTTESIDTAADTTLHALTVAVVALGLSGASLAAVSLLQAIYVFRPRVVDSTSPMEPLEIKATPLANLVAEHTALSPTDVIASLCREIHAVSVLQIARSRTVGLSALTFVAAVLCLIAAALLLAICFVAF